MQHINHQPHVISIDVGLRNYVLSVYKYMSIALLITTIVAFLSISFQPLMHLLYVLDAYGRPVEVTGIGILIAFAPLALSLYFVAGLGAMSSQTAIYLLYAYSACMGCSLSYIGILYTGASIIRTSLVCTVMFGSAAIYGHTTNKDLTSFGGFIITGMIGIFIASIINMVIGSPAIYYATSFAGVFITVGLIAWDNQKIKALYYANNRANNDAMSEKLAVYGALTLYMDFINLFVFLIRFLGQKRDN